MKSEETDVKLYFNRKFLAFNGLNFDEKMAFKLIEMRDGEDGCFASNKHFTKILGGSASKWSRIINKLAVKEYITLRYIYHDESKKVNKRIARLNKENPLVLEFMTKFSCKKREESFPVDFKNELSCNKKYSDDSEEFDDFTK